MPQPEDPALDLLGGVVEHELEEEAVELRLRQRIRALVLDRVLRADDEERVGQRPRLALDRHLPLLHRLEQRGLGLRRRPVDLVREQDVGEDRPGPERDGALAEHHRPGQVRGQHVGRELRAPEREAERPRRRVREQRLRDAGHALEEHVPAREQRRQQAADDLVLAEDDLADLGSHPVRDARQRLHPARRSSRAAARPSATTCSGVRGSVSSAWRSSSLGGSRSAAASALVRKGSSASAGRRVRASNAPSDST